MFETLKGISELVLEAAGRDGSWRGLMTRLNPRHRFDAYVVGAANRLAVTAARAVAESPGAAYNPLFIYAGSGLGKTHLLMAHRAPARWR